jgi:hypothetical protein
MMPSPIFTRGLKCEPTFPERLDDEHTYLSYLCEVSAHDILSGLSSHTIVSLRVAYRHFPDGSMMGLPHLSETFRAEVFGIPQQVTSDAILSPSQGFFDKIADITRTVGLASVTSELLYPSPALLRPDPGDLPGHWIVDGEISNTHLSALTSASHHHLMHLAAHPNIELLRIP